MFWQVHVILELDEILAKLGHKVIDWEILLTIQLRQLEMMQTLQNIGFREDDYQKDNFLLKDPIRPFWSILRENIWRNISILKGFWTIRSWNKRTLRLLCCRNFHFTENSKKLPNDFFLHHCRNFRIFLLLTHFTWNQFRIIKMFKPEHWFHVKSEWQINSVISTLWFTVQCGNYGKLSLKKYFVKSLI